MHDTFSIVVTGLGGQGILLVSKAIAAAACRQFDFVCRTETRGLSQRGGAVCTFVRFGSRNVAPVVGTGSADLVLALDALEGVRALSFLKPVGRMIANAGLLPPANLLDAWRQNGAEDESRAAYSRHLRNILETHDGVSCLELEALAAQANSPRGLNAVLLGAASRYLPVTLEDLRIELEAALKPQHRAASLAAFDLGSAAVMRTIEHGLEAVA